MGCTESVPIAPQQKPYSNNQQYLPSNPTLPSTQNQQSYYSQPQYQQKYYTTAQMYPNTQTQYYQPQYTQQQYYQPQYAQQQYAQQQYYAQQPNYVPQQVYVQPQVQNQRPSTMNTVAAVAGGVILGDMISDMLDPID